MTSSIPKLSSAIVLVFLLVATAAPKAEEAATSLPPISHRVAGGQFDFIVWDTTSFARIGSRFGEGPKVLARENGKQVTDRLHAGDTIHVECEVIESRRSNSRPDRGLVRTRNRIIKQDGTLVQEYTPLRMVKARETAK